MFKWYRHYFCLFFILWSVVLNAQSSDFIVDEITFTGSDYTKKYIIFKEIDFAINDTISSEELQTIFNKNEKRLYDTQLFNKVIISKKAKSEEHIIINIHLEKNWFIFPAPIFEQASENFSTWSKTHNFSLNWVNYGIRMTHNNLSGNKDVLKVVYQRGFTQKYELEYKRPYIFKSTFGFLANAYFTTNKSMGYETIDNRVQYYDGKNDIVLRRFRMEGSIFHRPNLYIYHQLKFQYHHNKIDKKVAEEFNPNYFLNADTDLKNLLLEYTIKFDKRVFKLYPEDGYVLSASIKKDGLGVFNDLDLLNIKLGYEQYWQINDIYLFQIQGKVKTELTKNKIPYSNYSAIGYGNAFIRGYEQSIMDGKDYFIQKNSLRIRLKEFFYNWKKWMPLKPYKKMDGELYVRSNFEMAYVNDPYYADFNPLNNEFLLGFGPAMDLIIYHNYLFSFEYSFNRHGGHGFYLHNDITF